MAEKKDKVEKSVKAEEKSGKEAKEIVETPTKEKVVEGKPVEEVIETKEPETELKVEKGKLVDRQNQWIG